MRQTIALVLFAACAACTAISPPDVQVFKPSAEGLSAPTFVTASDQKDTIIRTLKEVGFILVDRIDKSRRIVRVTLGVSQGTQLCGTLNNVRYELRSNEQTEIEVEAKGWTGNCQPNVFEHTSRELAKSLAITPNH